MQTRLGVIGIKHWLVIVVLDVSIKFKKKIG